MEKQSPLHLVAMPVLALMCFLVLTSSVKGQDCLETCECHPLSSGVTIAVTNAAGCAPWGTELTSDLDSSLWADFAFEWNITGGAFAWQGESSPTAPNPALVLEETAVYQFALTVTDTTGSGCSATSGTMTYAVAGAPQVMISDAQDLCAWEEGVVEVLVNPGNTSLTSFAWGTGGVWDTLAFPAPLTQVFEVAGENEVIASASNACGSAQDTVHVEVYPTPALEVHSDYDWYCMGSYADFTVSGDGDFIWNANSELLSGGQPGDSTARFAVGSQLVGSVFTTIDHGTVQCTSSAGFTAYGFFVPSVTIGGDAVSCFGDEVDMQANVFSFGWDTSVEWILDGAPVDTVLAPSSSQSATVPFAWEGGAQPGMYEFQAAVTFDPYPAWLPDYGCADTTSYVVEVVDLPAVSVAPVWEVCNQAFVEPFPEAVPSGGTWQGPAGSVQLGVDPTDYGLGSHLFAYTYTDSNGCQSSDTTVLQVEEPVQAIAGWDSTFCESNAIVTVSSPQEGGWWSGPGVLFAESGVIDLGELAIGENPLVYTLGEGSCATEDEVIWEVLESPVAFISSEGSLFCHGDTVWFDVFAGGGTLAEENAYQLDWTDQVLFSDSGSAYYVANVDEPLEAIGLLVTDDAGCSDEAVTIVNPLPLPEITIPELGVECAQDVLIDLPQVSTASGTWSGVGIADAAGVFNPALVGIGSTELTFTATSAMGCENTSSAVLEVIGAPEVDAGDAVSVCEGAPALMLEGFYPAGGWWEGPVTAVTDSVFFDPSTSGVGSYEAVYHVGEGSCHVSDERALDVHALPILLPAFEAAICSGDTAMLEVDVLNASGPDGYEVMWTGENLLNGANPWSVESGPWFAGDAPQAEVSVTNEWGCAASALASWSVNALPEISVPGSWSVCSNVDTLLLPGASPTGGTWTGIGVAGDAFVPASASGETANLEYTYEDANGCANGATLVAELVAPLEMDLGPKLHACEGTGFFWLPTPEGLSGFWSGPGLVNNATGEVDLNALVPAAYAFAFTHEDEVCTSTAEVEMEVHAKPVVELTSTPVSCVDSLLTMSAAIGSGTAPFSYVWAIGGDTLVTAEPSYAASWDQPGFIDFALEVTDAWGCANAASWVAEVQPPASVALVTEMELCNQAIPVDLMQTVQPESDGNSNFHGLDLALDAVTASGLLSPELLPIGNHAVVYQFEPNNGCAFRDTIALAVGEAVSVEAGLDVSACFGPGMLDLPAENGAISVLWSASTALANAAIIDASTGLLDAGQLPVGMHGFAVSAGEGTCASSDSLVVEILDLPQLELPALGALCSNGSLVALPDPWPAGGIWQGPGVSNGAFDPEVSGMGEFSLTYGFVDDLTTCANEAMATVAVQAPLEPQISAPDLACVNAPVELALVDSAGFSEIQWYVGEEWGGMDSIASWSPAEEGTWTLLVEATDPNGCQGISSSQVVVQAVPQTELVLSNATGCSPMTVQFSTAEALNATNITWYVDGDAAGSDPALEAVLLAQDTATTHTVLLLAEHACGTLELTDSLTVVPSPQFDFSNAASAACTAQETSIEVNINFADALTWSSQDGEVFTGTTMEFMADSAGVFTYTLLASDATTGCNASETWSVTVHEPAELLLSPNATVGCSPFEVDFLIEDWDGAELTWLVGDSAFTANAASTTLTFEAFGIHEIAAAAVDANGCLRNAVQTVEVMPAPEVDWALEANKWCGVPAVVPVAVDADDAEVHWNVNGVLAAIGQSANLEFSMAGWHAIEAVVTNAFGCSKMLVDSLETLPLPSAAVSAEPLVGCSPLEVALTLEHDAVDAHLNVSSASMQWPMADADPVLVLDQAGGYQVALHVIDDRGCENTVELSDSIQVLPSPDVDFEPSPYAGTWDNPDPLNSSWSFENLSDAGEALWDFGDGTLSTIWDGAHTYDQPGTYAVNVMVVNAFGCAGEATLEVEVEENLQVFIPNAFTPPTNGYSDGVNDGWRPEISAPELVDSYWMRVFNRYGQLIWESHDPQEYWIGQAGQESTHFGMNDAYTWVLRVESRAQRPAQREWRGHVTLIR